MWNNKFKKVFYKTFGQTEKVFILGFPLIDLWKQLECHMKGDTWACFSLCWPIMTLFNGIFSFCFYAIDFWLRCRQPSGRFSVGGADVEPAKKKKMQQHTKIAKISELKCFLNRILSPQMGFSFQFYYFFRSHMLVKTNSFLMQMSSNRFKRVKLWVRKSQTATLNLCCCKIAV